MSKHAFEQEQRRDIRVEKDSLAGPGSLEYDYDAVAHALDIRPESSAVERTIDITTLGARTGTPRRIEVWAHHIDRRWYIAGVPDPATGTRTCAHIRGSSCISSTGSPPTCPRPRRPSTRRPGGG